MERKPRSALVWTSLLVAIVLVSTSLPSQGQDIGFERKRGKIMLKKVCREVEKRFYDPNLHGLDWEALCGQARQRIENAKSVGEMMTAIFAAVNQLQDSHTNFLPPKLANRTLFGFEAKAFGDEIRIYEVKEKGAAAKAGLQVGDRLLKINGFNTERRSFDLMWLYLRVLRPVAEMEIIFSRDDEPPRTMWVEGKTKQERILWDLTRFFDPWNVLTEQSADEKPFVTKYYEGDIGYLRLPYFTGRKFYKMFLKDKVNDIKKSHAVIIDLRGNPGGAVETTTYLISFFEPEPTVIVNIVGRKKTEPMKVKKPRRPNLPVPLFILVDSQSSSAAEIFARHFQRTGRAVVIGDTTSGRVTVSLTYSYKVGMDVVIFYGLQVAVGRVVFPDGEELEKRGVTPDHTCIPTTEDLREERDPCRDMALALAHKALAGPEQ